MLRPGGNGHVDGAAKDGGAKLANLGMAKGKEVRQGWQISHEAMPQGGCGVGKTGAELGCCHLPVVVSSSPEAH